MSKWLQIGNSPANVTSFYGAADDAWENASWQNCRGDKVDLPVDSSGQPCSKTLLEAKRFEDESLKNNQRKDESPCQLANLGSPNNHETDADGLAVGSTGSFLKICRPAGSGVSATESFQGSVSNPDPLGLPCGSSFLNLPLEDRRDILSPLSDPGSSPPRFREAPSRTNKDHSQNGHSADTLTKEVATLDSMVNPCNNPSSIKEGLSMATQAQQLPRFPLVDLPPALILEIFSYLEAGDLCTASCVCSLFHRLAAESVRWKDFYCQRWLPPALPERKLVAGKLQGDEAAKAARHWRDLYMDREIRAKAFQGRFQMDLLHGHTAGVRCVRMLPGANLAATGGYDSSVRIWNLEEGLCLAASAPLGETVRAMAMDANILAVGGNDGAIRVWRAIPECRHLFDVGCMWPKRDAQADLGKSARGGGSLKDCVGMDSTVYGHSGPVSCLAIDAGKLYSGSWDMTVRAWDRGQMACTGTFPHKDWVWAVAPRGGRLFSTAGCHLYSWDVEFGRLLSIRENVHKGQARAVEASRSGHWVFTGGEDGAVRMFDERSQRRPAGGTVVVENGAKDAVAVWHPHSSIVYSLALEDPWLVCSSGDNTCAMMNVRQVMVNRAGVARGSAGRRRKEPMGQQETGGTAVKGTEGHMQSVIQGIEEPIQRQLGGFPSPVYSIDIGADRLICGGDDMVVKVFDFTQALEIERRVQASRGIRNEKRIQRRQAAAQGSEQRAPFVKNSKLAGGSALATRRAHEPSGTGIGRGEVSTGFPSSDRSRSGVRNRASGSEAGKREPGAAKQRGRKASAGDVHLSKNAASCGKDSSTAFGQWSRQSGRVEDSVRINFGRASDAKPTDGS